MLTRLHRAAELVDVERSFSELAGDHDGADRLARLRDELYAEAEVLEVADWWAWRRTHPRGVDRSLGWLLAHDPDVRARRLASGLSVPAVERAA